MSLNNHFNKVFINAPAELLNITMVLIYDWISFYLYNIFIFHLNSWSHIVLKLSLAINKLHYSYFLGFDRRSTPPLPSRCQRFRSGIGSSSVSPIWMFTRFSSPTIEEAPSSLRHPPQFSWSRKEDAALQPTSQRGHSKYELMMCLASRCCDVFFRAQTVYIQMVKTEQN